MNPRMVIVNDNSNARIWMTGVILVSTTSKYKYKKLNINFEIEMPVK
jgi:hypothetical protein